MSSDFDDDDFEEDFGYDDDEAGMEDAAQPMDSEDELEVEPEDELADEDEVEDEPKPKKPKVAGPPIVFECLQFIAVGATIASIIILVMLLSLYGWKLPT